MSYRDLKFDPNEIIHWFNAVRNLPEQERNLALEAFWSGQLDSKLWLVDTLNSIVKQESNIYIFGGWIGTLASILFQCSTFKINKIRSIDIDPWCESVADTICKSYEMNKWKFKARTCDMSIYDYEWEINPQIVINTSTEHIPQKIYDQWYDKIPDDTLVVAQGNDFFICNGHIRCSKNLQEFKLLNHVNNCIFEGELKTDIYTRFMCIWKK
jgi:hypothetical protein